MITLKTEDELLAGIMTSLDNAADNQEILAETTKVGYDINKIGEGKEVCGVALADYQMMIKTRGEQKTAKTLWDKLWADARKMFSGLANLAKVPLRDEEGLQQSIGILEPRKVAYDGWLNQAKLFYTNIIGNSDLLLRLAIVKVTEQHIKDFKSVVEGVEAKHNAYIIAKGISQQARANKDKAFTTMKKWYHDFVAAVRVALQDKPQLLESLGIVVPSDPKPKRKNTTT
jgi:hypothetical protein